MENLINGHIYKEYLKSLLAGNKQECANIVNNLLSKKIELKNLYENLLQRALYEIGGLWEKNEISVAVEHLATSITATLMNFVYPILFSSEKKGKKAVVSCVTNEFHQIGGQMVADIMELNGWDAYFLGANTPVDELIAMISEKKPDLLALSVSIYFNVPKLQEIIYKIKQKFGSLPIIVGGQAFQWGGLGYLKKIPEVTYISSLNDLENFIRNT